MFQDLIGWLTSTEPISRWVLILMLLGLLAAFCFAMSLLSNYKGDQKHGS